MFLYLAYFGADHHIVFCKLGPMVILKLVLTEAILEEYTRVTDILSQKYSTINLFPFIELLTVNTEICTPVELPHPVSPDPDDDKFIAWH